MRFVRIFIIVIIALALGGLIGLGAAGLFERMAGAVQGEIILLIFIPWLLLGVFLILLVHELGHVAAGRLVGFEFILLIVGPLTVMRTAQGISYSLNRNMRFFGGLTANAPPDDRDLDRRMAITTAGGPLASLLFSGLSLLLTRPLLRLDFTTGFTALLVSVFSGLVFILTLIPRRAGGLMSDGARLLSLARGGEDARLRSLMIVLQAELMAGVRPRDLNPVALQELLHAQDDSFMGVATGLVAYYHYLDAEEIEQAGEQLVRALKARERLPVGFREGVALEAAYFYAVQRVEAGKARKYLEESKGAVAEEHTRLRAEAAVLLLEGKREAAEDAVRKGIQAAEKSFQRGAAQAEIEWMQALLEK
jgi:hypothetical protein